MAVDTEVKRWAMLSFGDGVLTHVVINPTGTDMGTKNERASLLGLYGGIAIDGPGGVTVVPIFLLHAPTVHGSM